MSAFDTVRIINLDDVNGNFLQRHNIKIEFQTKDLACNGSLYFIFNNQLYLEFDGESSYFYDTAIPQNISGEFNVYGIESTSEYEYWVEYLIALEDGNVSKVESVRYQIIKDKRSIDKLNPKTKENNVVMISIDINNLDSERKQLFVEKISNKIDDIRALLEEPNAAISYPVKNEPHPIISFGITPHGYHNVLSIVQTIPELKKYKEENDHTSNDDVEKKENKTGFLIFDEFHNLVKRS